MKMIKRYHIFVSRKDVSFLVDEFQTNSDDEAQQKLQEYHASMKPKDRQQQGDINQVYCVDKMK